MTPRWDVERLQRTFVDAMSSDSFERHGLRRGTWDVSRDCENPVPVGMHSRATGLVKNRGKQIPGIELNLLTPCRRCRVCLAKKSRLWAYRARNEIAASERTWFGTLTCKPEVHYWLDAVCSTRKRNFREQSPDKKFAEQALVLGSEVTKYLKRVRKNSGCSFRYLMVTEIHNSAKTSEEMRGRPHVHLLVHEFAGQPIKKSELDGSWKHGHSQWRLADGERAAWYISKYISKASDARTRASLDYGTP